jgi:hypothetical protein
MRFPKKDKVDLIYPQIVSRKCLTLGKIHDKRNVSKPPITVPIIVFRIELSVSFGIRRQEARQGFSTFYTFENGYTLNDLCLLYLSDKISYGK